MFELLHRIYLIYILTLFVKFVQHVCFALLREQDEWRLLHQNSGQFRQVQLLIMDRITLKYVYFVLGTSALQVLALLSHLMWPTPPN